MRHLLFYTILGLSILLTNCSDDDAPKRVGLNDPLFKNIPESWVSPYFQLDMQEIWSFYGLNRTGSNYYFLSKPDGFSCSSRFIPSSIYFQSWVGIYTVEDNQNGTYAIESGVLDAEAIIALAIADQKAWLTFFGLENPEVYIDQSVDITIENIEIDNLNGWKLNGGLISNVDVGDNNPQFGQVLIDIDKIYWNESVSSYQDVKLDVTAYIWHSVENGELNVAYFNLVAFETNDGLSIKNDEIREELEEMVQSVTVYESE